MDGENTSNVKNKGTWMRLVHMVVLAIAFNVSELVIAVTVVYQFLTVLFTGAPNDNARRLGSEFGSYMRAIARYMTYDTEERPFPYAPWGTTQNGSAIVTPPPGDSQTTT